MLLQPKPSHLDDKIRHCSNNTSCTHFSKDPDFWFRSFAPLPSLYRLNICWNLLVLVEILISILQLILSPKYLPLEKVMIKRNTVFTFYFGDHTWYYSLKQFSINVIRNIFYSCSKSRLLSDAEDRVGFSRTGVVGGEFSFVYHSSSRMGFSA